MTLRTRILLSYLILIAIVICGFYFIFDDFAISLLTRAHINTARAGIENMSSSNQLVLQKTIRTLGTNILDLVAERDANRAGMYFKEHPQSFQKDLAAMRKDEQLREIVAHPIMVYGREAGYTDMFDRTGTALMHPYPHLEGKNYSEWASEYPQMWKMVQESFSRKFVSGDYTFFDRSGKQVQKYMVIRHIPNTDFNLVACVIISEYFDPVCRKIEEKENQLSDNTCREIQAASEISSNNVKLFSIPLIAAAALISLLFGLWFSTSIARPLKTLIDAIGNLGKGNFSVQVPERGSAEVAELTRCFNRLGTQLSNFIQTVKKEIAARQEVESEIKIARSLQESLLPKSFPQSGYFDLGAKLQPAREVAGDFYDSFMVGGKLAIIIGDVSGKGVPAAFFMAVARTMLRDLCHTMSDPTPAVILQRANQLLCEENETCMFVTLFMAFLDIDTGELQYANGGHNEVIRRTSAGEISCFGFTGDMALGIMSENKYQNRCETLQPGDLLVLFTDGITEAVSRQQILYGFERLSGVVAQSSDLTAAAICDRIVDDVIEYEAGNRFDDITIIALKYLK